MLTSFSRAKLIALKSQVSLFQQLKRKFSSPQKTKQNFSFTDNPIIFNKINDQYVIRGKERVVGLWLLGVSASIFSMIILGGYTRLSRSGLSMTKWHPHKVGLPRDKAEWELEFEEYKKFPEFYVVNKDMTLEGFKGIYFVEWAHRIVARSFALIFVAPMGYFWYRGYFQKRLKMSLGGVLGLGLIQGVIGWWMVKSGLVDKNKTKELDKTPNVSPYRFVVHALFAYTMYCSTLWLSLHLLRRPQEAIITLQNMSQHNAYRKILMRSVHGLLPFVLLSGFFTAGIKGRHACNSFPMVGDSYFISKKHLNNDIPIWKNFTENKLVVQVTHRTLAILFVLLALKSTLEVRKLSLLSPMARRSFYLILAAMGLQVCIGACTVWYPGPISIANSHQAGAVILLSSLVFGLHTCRRVDPRHIRNLLGKIKVEDPSQYKKMMEGLHNQKQFKKDEIAGIKKFFDEK